MDPSNRIRAQDLAFSEFARLCNVLSNVVISCLF
jgi:hypothetical protein